MLASEAKALAEQKADSTNRLSTVISKITAAATDGLFSLDIVLYDRDLTKQLVTSLERDGYVVRAISLMENSITLTIRWDKTEQEMG